jgi:hypothetical protein
MENTTLKLINSTQSTLGQSPKNNYLESDLLWGLARGCFRQYRVLYFLEQPYLILPINCDQFPPCRLPRLTYNQVYVIQLTKQQRNFLIKFKLKSIPIMTETSTQRSKNTVPSLSPASNTSVIFMIILAACAASIIIWYIAVYSQFAADDAYIHMRIARNFAEQGVPYFNPQEAASGSSSPLWLLIMTALFKLIAPTPQLVPIMTAVFTLGILGASTLILSEKYPRLVALILSFILVMTAVNDVAAQLMETPAALFFWLVSIIYLKRKSFVWSGVWAGLSFATRYEFVIWLLLIALIPKDRRARQRLISGAAIPTIAVGLFNLMFFHTLLPNTVRAKSIIYSISPAESLVGAKIITGIPLFVLIAALHLFLAIYFAKRQNQPLMAGILLFGITIISLYVTRKTLIFPWYIPIFLFPLLFSYWFAYPNPNGWVRFMLLIFTLVFGVLPMTQISLEMRGLWAEHLTAYRYHSPGLRVQQYLNIGQQLTAKYPDATLLTSEVGGLGWTFPGEIIDAAGVITPDALKYHPLAVPDERSLGSMGAIPPAAVRDYQPDLIVSMEIFSEALREAMANGQFPEYQLMQNYPVLADDNTTLWGAKWIQVYTRQQ